MKRISPHISYHEATHSATANRHGITNFPSGDILNKMKIVAKEVFEPVRTHYNVPILVTSFYRCPDVNRLVGGARTSQHMDGEALDMDAILSTGLTNVQIFEWIKNNLEFDQLIWEFGNIKQPAWVHCSYKESGNRNQILYIR